MEYFWEMLKKGGRKINNKFRKLKLKKLLIFNNKNLKINNC